MQWQKVVYGDGDGTSHSDMRDHIHIDRDMPLLKIQNARLSRIDLPPDYMAVLFKEPDYKGSSVRVYADEVITGVDRIGSVQFRKKAQRDYELIEVTIQPTSLSYNRGSSYD